MQQNANQEIMMLEKSILMNWEKSKNLKSKDSSPLIEFAN